MANSVEQDSTVDEDEEVHELERDSQTNKSAQRTSNQNSALGELCAVNGVKYEKLRKGAGRNVKVLEMFFSGFPQIVGMENFPNLQVLTLMGQEIKVLQNLDCLPQLTELCVSECQLTNISGLSLCQKLKKLHLYANNISKIENLGNLVNLKILWLNNNNISHLDGLQNLTALVDLNLADNNIRKIGDALEGLLNLETLDLSANKLTSFKDLTNLNSLTNLRSLSLKDPVYGSNPVALLCNYSTHLLYHLPSLKRLDSYDVDNKMLKDLAESTVTKKKMYYNMRVKTLHRNKADLLSRLGHENETLQAIPQERIKRLWFNIKEVEVGEPPFVQMENKKLKEQVDGESQEPNTTRHTKQRKREALLMATTKWTKQSNEMEACYEQSCRHVKAVSQMTVQRLLLELETGGNVRFEDGKPSSIWYKSCHDLILSRFCVGDYLGMGVTGMKIHRITRVHNRILRMRFDDKLDNLLDREDVLDLLKGGSPNRLLEYLFFVCDPAVADNDNELLSVLEDGFRDSSADEVQGVDEGVPLSNSICVSDKPRIRFMAKKAREMNSADPYPFRHGQLLVAKAFVGNAVASRSERKITRTAYPDAHSVFRPQKHENCPSRLNSTPRGPSSCECSTRQCAWFVFDHELVLPEYVVDFEYSTRLKPQSPLIYYYGDAKRMTTAGSSEEPNPDPDWDVFKMEPVIKQRPRLVALTEELLMKQCGVSCLQNVTVLNLHGNGLCRLKHMNCMTAVKKLVVSFNELTKLDDISHMNFLEYVDVSFNKITTLEGFKGCSRIKHLDLSWNQLKHTREELGHMRKHVITLTCLDTRHNPWLKIETLRMRALGRLKNLVELDGVAVSDEELTTALKMAAASRISSFAVVAHSRTDEARPRTLSLAPAAHSIVTTSLKKPARPMDEGSQWFIKVTTLSLDKQHLGKLSNLDKLENLRWASFNDNDLTKIEGLEACIQLEELSLEGNCISRLEGLNKHSQLKWLNLSNNNLSSLDSGILEKLVSLQYLSVENNFISSLRGLENLHNIQELYIGNNQVSNVREVFHLKNILTLVILDLCGNPLAANTKNYRLFVVYHVTSLKALDGLAVEFSENGVAKDTFGGRMTSDFIAERLGHSNFFELSELDFPQCSLHTVDLANGEAFINLRSVNLEHNSLTSFGGLINLVNLKILCLNHNHIESITSKLKAPSPANAARRSGEVISEITNPENFTPVLPKLEVLHLGYNGISSMAGLQLSRLTNLKALFLQGNEISKVDGLEGLQDLRELVLDRNKIKAVSEYSFINQWNLVELHLEENRIRQLTHFGALQSLQRLYVGMNKIQDITELERLESIGGLIELSVINNAVTRRLHHRPMLVFRMPNLLSIDGIPVSNEERTKAELYFIEQQGGVQSVTSPLEPTLPGIVTARPQAPLRVTTMHLTNSMEPNWGPGSRQELTNGTIQIRNLDQQLDKAARRRGGTTRGQAGPQSLPHTDSSHSLANDRNKSTRYK